MGRMFVRLWLAVAVAATAGLFPGIPIQHSASIAQAQDTDPPSEVASPSPREDDTSRADEATSGCDRLVPGVSQVCQGVTGAIGDGVGAVVAGGARSAMVSLVEFVVDGAGWLVGRLMGVIDRTTRADVTARWFRGAYGDMATIAMLGLLPFLLLAIIQGIVRQSPEQLLRSAFLYVPLAALGTGAAVVVVDMLVRLTDNLSAWIAQSMGTDLTAFATGFGTALSKIGPSAGGVAGLAALLAAGAAAFAAFVIWLELLLRQAAIYVAVLFLPLGFMALVWPATAHWLRRLVQGLVAIILSKFVIVAVMALAATALDANVVDDGFGSVVAGASMLSLAALAPYVLLRLIPVFEAGLSSGLEGTLRRPTAAVAPPAAAHASIPQLLRQRVGRSGGSMAGVGVGGSASTAVRTGGASAAGLGVATAGAGLVAGGAGLARRSTSQATAGTAEVATGAEQHSREAKAAPSSSGDRGGPTSRSRPVPPADSPTTRRSVGGVDSPRGAEGPDREGGAS